jgi:MFS family permease
VKELDSDSPAVEGVSSSAFHYRGFVLYWLGRFLNAFSIQITSVAVGWQIYDQTRDPFLLGLVGLVQFAPSLALVLYTGAAADRYNRRHIMGLCIAVESVCVLALMAITWSALGAVWPIFGILFVFGIARAFYSPAMTSLAVNLVPAAAFPNAVAWNSSSFQTAMIMGPVFGGLLYGISPLAPYAAAALCLFAASALTLMIPKPAQKSSDGPRSSDKLLAGVRYIWRQPVVLGAISLDLFAVLLGGATALMPVFARDVLEVGPLGLGLLRSAPGIGAVAMGIWLVRNPIGDHAGRIMFAAVAVFGTAIIAFGLSKAVWLSVIALIVMGAADMVSVYIRASLVQLSTPDDVRGRVSAVNMVFIGASNEVGEFRAGSMAALIGAVPSVVVGGIATLFIAVIGARIFPELLNTRRLAGR